MFNLAPPTPPCSQELLARRWLELAPALQIDSLSAIMRVESQLERLEGVVVAGFAQLTAAKSARMHPALWFKASQRELAKVL